MIRILIILLLIIIIAPKLFVYIITPIALAALLFIPAIIITKNISILIHGPLSILRLAFDPVTRRNHAIEHAAIHVLEEKYSNVKVSGYSTQEGFKISGWLPSADIVYQAVEEGLQRLRNGEKRLAVHKRCGTTILISNILSSIIILLFLLGIGKFSIIVWFAIIILVNFISQPIGVLIQKYLTTNTNVENVFIRDLVLEQTPSNPLMIFLSPVTYSITTGTFRIVNPE